MCCSRCTVGEAAARPRSYAVLCEERRNADPGFFARLRRRVGRGHSKVEVANFEPTVAPPPASPCLPEDKKSLAEIFAEDAFSGDAEPLPGDEAAGACDLAAGCDPDFLRLNCQVRFPFVFNATDVIMCMLVACP